MTLSPQLRRVLGRNLRAPSWVLDDACQIAWETFIRRDERVDESHVLGWLATTARREALVMLSRDDAELSLDDAGGAAESCAWSSDPSRILELREHLGRVAELPWRQQRLAWMRGLGFDCQEMCAQTGDTPRTVRRQLAAAHRRLGAITSTRAA